MIPIYLKKETIEALHNGDLILKTKFFKKLCVDDILMRNLAFKKRVIEGKQRILYNYKERGVKVKMSKDKEIDYMDIFDGLTPQEQVFFILYNSPNYTDQKFGISPYLNEDICYMLAFLSEEEFNCYGSFLENKVERETIEDGGYDKIKNKFDNTMGLFKFKDHHTYALLHAKATKVRNKDSIRKANSELVKTFCGDDAEIKNEVIKNTYDMFKNSTNEKTRTECAKLLGNWFGIEKRDSDVTLRTILEGVNVGEILQNSTYDNGED